MKSSISDLKVYRGKYAPPSDRQAYPSEPVHQIMLNQTGSNLVERRLDWGKWHSSSSYAFALVSVAAALNIQDNIIQDARVAMGGVAHKPWRAFEAEEMLVGKPANEDTFRQAVETALAGAQTYEHNDFKVELGKRAIAII